MRTRAAFDLPDELEPLVARAQVLEWLTLGTMLVFALGIWLCMGDSQTMKAACLEDLLACVTPTAFLLSARYRLRAPNERFPYGYHRSVSIAFLTGSVALTSFGLWILVDSVRGLLHAHHPSIGASVVLGHVLWSGWLMIGVLVASSIPTFVLGRLKLRIAGRIHDKTLKADADMNRADWQTDLAGIVGIAGIGMGWWWADAAAGAFISAAIVRDGARNLREVVADLMDSYPRTVEGKPSDVPERVRRAVEALPWVQGAEVRMREEGHVFNGELFVRVVEGDCRDLRARLEEARRAATAVDWRVHDIVVEFEDVGRRG
jgi:cation diffusion facilitator family transporter